MINGLATTFTVCAILGGSVFVIRLLLMFIGAVDHGDMGSADVSDASTEVDITHSDVSFKLLSLQGITAFFMMFGLAGRALLLDSRVSPTLSLAGATVAGAAAVWVIAKIFAFMKSLQSPGGTLDLKKAIGQSGTVYLTIPAGGAGKASVAVQGRLGIFDAVAENKQSIATGDAVRVVGVTDDNLLVVARNQ